jgi:hypothetical protein
MRALAIVNLGGVVAAAVFAGWAVGGGYMPTMASLAALAFLAGFFLPFLREQAELQRGLERVEREFLAQRRRELGLIRREVFTNRLSRPIWRRKGPSPMPVLLVTAAGVGLLALDVLLYLRQGFAAEAVGRTISNF